MYALAHEYVGEAVVAAAGFHTARGESAVLGGGLGLIVTAATWVFDRLLSGLPSNNYWVLTRGELVVLEFRFGSATRLQREVGRWDLVSLPVADAG